MPRTAPVLAPRTGKRRSRRNAFRHGLTAETIINVVENAADYRKLEAQLKADFHPQTTIEQQLVARLASLLWRLRRATAIESGLFQIQIKILSDRGAHLNSIYTTDKTRLNIFYELIPSLSPPPQPNLELRVGERDIEVGLNQQADESSIEHLDMARSFLRLANLDNGTFERLGRYETRLWRQLAQTVLLIAQVCKLNREPLFLGNGEFLGFARRKRR